MKPVNRPSPPPAAPEREMLDSWLDFHRATLLNKCAGLSEARLKERAVPPSPLSLLGIVRHMTDVERGWFSRGLAGEDSAPIYYSDDDPDGDFVNLDSSPVDDVFALFQAECDRSRAHAAAAASLDQPTTRNNRNGQAITFRWIMVHMVEEYARHNGHADFLRERIDGETGE